MRLFSAIAIALPEAKKVPPHNKRILEKFDTTVRSLPPHHGRFFYLITFLPGQAENFNVKRETVKRYLGKNIFSRLALKTLESALGVLKAAKRDPPDKKIEDPSGKPAFKRLLDITPFFADRAGARHPIVAFLHEADQAVHFLDRRRKKNVRHEHKLPAEGLNPAFFRGGPC